MSEYTHGLCFDDEKNPPVGKKRKEIEKLTSEKVMKDGFEEVTPEQLCNNCYCMND